MNFTDYKTYMNYYLNDSTSGNSVWLDSSTIYGIPQGKFSTKGSLVTYPVSTSSPVTYTTTCDGDSWHIFDPGDLGIRNKKLSTCESYHLPDGSLLVIDSNGNYKIEDKDAKVTYRANRSRDFSPHINASDMLAEFVAYAGSIGIKKDEVLQLPIQLFISWLIIEAAARDDDPIAQDVIPIANDPAVKQVLLPKCYSCGRFIPRLHARSRFPFCNPSHAQKYLKAPKRALVSA